MYVYISYIILKLHIKMIYNVKHIVQKRSMKRNKDTGEMMVKVIWEDGTKNFEPLCSFYNGLHYNEHMDVKITEHKQTAIEYPYHKRHCLVCDERVYDGMIFCGGTVECMSIKERYE